MSAALALPAGLRAPAATQGTHTCTVSGTLPPWLRGALVRTAPARFEVGAWRAAHWFDALGMLFAFDLTDTGVTLRHRDVESTIARRLAAGRNDIATFATPTQRSWAQRLRGLVPETSDNTNVNIVPRGDGLVALTETPTQLLVDPRTLAVTGTHAWRDALGPLLMTAHPVFDRTTKRAVDVCTQLVGRSYLAAVEHDDVGRTELARWYTPRVPYVHSFGVTKRSVVLVAHPFTVLPLAMLASNRGYVDHFRWDGGAPTRLVILDRRGGPTREVEAPTGFVFHVIDAFDDGDDLVLDALVYRDPSIVDALRTEALTRALPSLGATATRFRVRPGRSAAEVSPLAAEPFEFPITDARTPGVSRRFVWGADPQSGASCVLRIDLQGSETARFADGVHTWGEPVFVARPGSTDEGDGVVLTVGTDGERATLAILDARTLLEVGRAVAPIPLPLGFHGGFVRAR